MSKTTEELAKEAGMEECPDGCWATSGALASVYTESLKRFRQLCIAEERARLLDVARGPVGHFVYIGNADDHSLGLWVQIDDVTATPLHSAPINARAIREAALEEAMAICKEENSLEHVSGASEEYVIGRQMGAAVCLTKIRALNTNSLSPRVTGYSPTNEQHFVKVLFPSEADAKAFKAALEKQ